jgi:hypothetical protein
MNKVLHALKTAAPLVVIVLSGCSCFAGGSSAIEVPTGQVQEGVNPSLNFILPLAILGIAGGIAVSYLGVPKIGIPIATGSLAAIVATLVLIRYAGLIAIAGVILGVASLIWEFISRYRGMATTVANAGSTITDLVKGIQAVKAKIVNSKASVTKEDINQTLAENQSPQTKAVVQEVKSGLSS